MDPLLRALYLVSLAAFGLVFGSFANVVIWRFPRGESIVTPGSHCPNCGNPVRPLDNIPLVSWLILRARCRDCGEPISVRYPLVEGLSGTLWVVAGLRFGFAPAAGAAVLLFYLLLLLAFIDLDTMRLPNALVGTMGALGLVAAAVSQLTRIVLVPLTPPAPLASPLWAALLGAALGGGLLGALSRTYGAVRGKPGFGLGDVKLAAAGGLFVGPYILLALLLASLLAIAGSVVLVRGGEGPVATRRFPFGPFLATGIVLAAVYGPALVAWYGTFMHV